MASSSNPSIEGVATGHKRAGHDYGASERVREGMEEKKGNILYINGRGCGCGYEKGSRLGPDQRFSVLVLTLIFCCFQVNRPFL